MEALTEPSAASPALHQLSLRTLASVDTWVTDPAKDAVEALVDEADDEDVMAVPESIGAVLSLLLGSGAHLDAALDAIVRFDLHEAAGGLAVLVWRRHQKAILAAAALSANPAVSAWFRELVAAHGSDLTESWQRDLYRMRMNPAYEPETDVARIDRRVRWLPPHGGSDEFPAAAVMPASAPTGQRGALRLVVDLVSAGAVVRRPPGRVGDGADPRWLPKWVPIISDSDKSATGQHPHGHVRAVAQSREVRRSFSKLLRQSDREAIIRFVGAVAGQRPLGPVAPQNSSAEWELLRDVSNIEVFDDGALPRREVAYLSGLRQRQFADLKRYDNLQPSLIRGVNYWTFSQLVGLRAARYLFRQSRTTNRGLGQVADRLVGLARDRRTVPVAITRSGEVLVKDNGTLYNIESGQTVEESIVSMVDDVYRPFIITGAHVPALLKPSDHTEVHPQIVAGLPHIHGTRVTAAAVSKSVSALRSGHNPDPWERTASIFGITPSAARDADTLGVAIQAVR